PGDAGDHQQEDDDDERPSHGLHHCKSLCCYGRMTTALGSGSTGFLPMILLRRSSATRGPRRVDELLLPRDDRSPSLFGWLRWRGWPVLLSMGDMATSIQVMRLVWVTDIHLNFLEPAVVEAFFAEIADSNADAVLVGGDISVAPTVERFLQG